MGKYDFQWVGKGQVLRHLGFPIGVGLDGKTIANWVLDRVARKFIPWYDRLMSFRARVVVVRAVLAPTIVYPLSICLFIKTSLRRFEKSLRKFVWNEGEETSKFHYTS